MAYQKPMVLVYQEYSTTSGTSVSAELPVCIIGPCYHIIDADNDETLAYAGEYTTVGIEKAVFPNNAAGALIDESTITFRLNNAYTDLHDSDIALDGTEASFTSNSITLTDDTLISVLEVGDYVYFDTDSYYTYRVTDVDTDSKEVQLNRSVPDTATTVRFRRCITDIYFTPDSPYIDVDANSELYSMIGLKAEINGTEYTINNASLYIGYKALRQDVTSIMTLETTDDIEGKLGTISPENPLAYGAMIALSNTTTSVMAIGVESDDLTGYTSAKDRIETIDPCYSMVPLTFSTEVLTMFKNSAEQLSEAEYGMWRITFGCSELQTETTLASGYGKCTLDGNDMALVFTATGGTVSTATGAEDLVEFQSNGVAAGDALVITYDGTEYEYTVSGVASEDMLTVTPSNPFADVLVDGTPEVSFTIKHTMDKSEQASAIASVSESYGSHRFIHVWPDICIIDDVELPGYYLCCAVAGGVAGLPSQYGFTNLSMSGIGGVKHSSDYFSQTQLNTIAEGGTFIFVQETENSAPYVRHQLTSDMSTTEFMELSFVKNFDYVAYCCKSVLKPYIGTWNVTEAALSAISTSLSAALESLKLDVTAQIGAPLINYAITDIYQSEEDRTRVECYVDLTFPYPLNTIGLHLVSV